MRAAYERLEAAQKGGESGGADGAIVEMAKTKLSAMGKDLKQLEEKDAGDKAVAVAAAEKLAKKLKKKVRIRAVWVRGGVVPPIRSQPLVSCFAHPIGSRHTHPSAWFTRAGGEEKEIARRIGLAVRFAGLHLLDTPELNANAPKKAPLVSCPARTERRAFWRAYKPLGRLSSHPPQPNTAKRHSNADGLCVFAERVVLLLHQLLLLVAVRRLEVVHCLRADWDVVKST